MINYVDIKTKLAYGRLNITKNLLPNSEFICRGNVNLLKDYPIYYFDCLIKSPDKKKLLKEINNKNNLKGKKLYLSIKGNLNILNRKINFDNIEMDEQYKATEKDLNNYKLSFEKNLFDESFIKIFKIEKIQNFLTDIL